MNKICAHCKKEFENPYPTAEYCSQKCRRNEKKERRRDRNKNQYTCSHCDKDFWRSKDRGHVYKFCSKNCAAAAKAKNAPGTYTRIYFILCVLTQRVKIGISDTVEYRFNQLRAANGDDVQLLGTIPGGFELEQSIHRELGDHHVHHEFFDYAAPVVKNLVDRYLYSTEEGTLEAVPSEGCTDGPQSSSVSEQPSLSLCVNRNHIHDYVSGPECLVSE